MMTIAVGRGFRRGRLSVQFLDQRRRHDHVAQAEPDFGRSGRLARVGSAEDHVLHLVAAQALGALLA
jgi:hypothetical protein